MNKIGTLSLAFLFLSLGIWLSDCFHTPFLFAFGITVITFLGSLIALRGRFYFVFLILSITFLGASILSINTSYPTNHIKNFTSDEPKDVYMEAIVVSQPCARIDRFGQMYIDFLAEAIRFIDNRDLSLTGLVRVKYFPQQNVTVEYGDQLTMKGVLKKPQTFSENDNFDYRGYLARNRIFSILTVRKSGFVEVIGKNQASLLKDKIFRFKQRLKGLLFRHIPGVEGEVLSGIILGDRYGIPQQLTEKFVSTGTVHVLAISGLHVGLVIFVLLVLFKSLRLKKAVSYPAIILIIVAYCILTGTKTPVVRATIMAVIFLIGELLGRRRQPLTWLALSGILMLLFSPQQLFDAGFQLSFLSVGSIIFFTPMLERIFKCDIRQNWFVRYPKQALAVSTAAWIGIIPVVAYHFQLISPICLLANIPVVGILSLLVAAGLAFFGLGIFSDFFAEVFAQPCHILVKILISTVEIFFKVPMGSFKVPKPHIYIVMLYYAGIMTLQAFLIHREKLRK